MIIQRSGSVNKPDVLELLQSQAKEPAKMNVSIYLETDRNSVLVAVSAPKLT